MKKQSFRKVLAFSAASLLAISLTHAASVTINNYSFEIDAANNGGGVRIPTGWAGFNDNNFSSSVNGNYTVAIPDGSQYYAINEGPSDPTGGIYQMLGLLQPNTTYTLTVALGHRGDFADNFGSPGIISLINGSDNTGTLLSSTSGYPAVHNNWADYTTIFTTGASVSGNLTIALSVAPSGGYQANFDNVRLDATTVPEPASLALLGGGLLTLLAIKRKAAKV